MELLSILPGFILAIIVMIKYGYKILSNSSKIGKNRVRFYVARDKYGPLWLYIGKPVRSEETFSPNEHGYMVSHSSSFDCLRLDIDDYKDLKWEDEPKEVFLNLED